MSKLQTFKISKLQIFKGSQHHRSFSSSDIADKNTYPVFVAFNMSMDEATALAKKIHGSSELPAYFEVNGDPRPLPQEINFSRKEQLKFLKNWHQGLLDLM